MSTAHSLAVVTCATSTGGARGDRRERLPEQPGRRTAVGGRQQQRRPRLVHVDVAGTGAVVGDQQPVERARAARGRARAPRPGAAGRASPSASKSPGVPSRTCSTTGRTLRSGTPARCSSGCRLKPGPAIAAEGLRVRARREHAPEAAARVRQGRVEQRSPDALPLEARAHGVRRQHPEQVAPERHGEAREPAAVLGHPAAARVGREQVARPGDPLARPARGTWRGEACPLGRRLVPLGLGVGLEGQLLGGGHVLGEHRPDHQVRYWVGHAPKVVAGRRAG